MLALVALPCRGALGPADSGSCLLRTMKVGHATLASHMARAATCRCRSGIPTDIHPTTGKSALETVLTVRFHANLAQSCWHCQSLLKAALGCALWQVSAGDGPHGALPC